MRLVFKGGTIGITGYGVIASQIGNLSGRISNYSICKVQDITGRFVQDIFRLVVNGAASCAEADVLCILADAGNGCTIGDGAAYGGSVGIFHDVNLCFTGFQCFYCCFCGPDFGIEVGIIYLDELFRFVYGVVGVVDLGSGGNGGSEASGILVHHGGIGAVGYGGSDLICFLQAVGNIFPFSNVGIGLASYGINGGLLSAIGELGFFFCCAAEVGSGLALSLHFFRCLMGQLGGGIGTVIVGYLAYNRACRIGFYIQSFIGNLVLRFVGDVFGSVVGDILGLIGDRTVVSSVGDICCRLGDASASVVGFVGNGGNEASGILAHHGGIGAIGYGGTDLICFLQVDGFIGSILNIGNGMIGKGIDGGLLVTINQLGFFFYSSAEIGSGLAISLHFFLCLIGQLGGQVAILFRIDNLGRYIAAFYSQSTLVPVTICIGSSGPSGSAVFIVVDSAFFYAVIFRVGGCLVGGDFTGCHFRFGRYVVVTYKIILGHVDFIHIQLAFDRQVAAGGDGFNTQVLHTGKVAILHGCRAIGDAFTLDSAVCVNVTDKGSTGPRNVAACVNLTHCRDVARRSYGAAGYRSGGVDAAGCSQISILEGSYTVCQFISGDSTVACIDITSVGTKCSTLGIDVSATSLNKTSIGFNVAVHAQVAFHFCIALNGQGTANGSAASGYISGISIYCEVTIAYFQIAVCIYISVNGQICHFCFGFIYISVCYISSFSISVFYISRICFRL